MTTYLHVQGADAIELADEESFNKVRSRINMAVTGTDRDGERADDKERNRPLHKLSFATSSGGRIAVNPEKVIGVSSDEAKDTGSSEE